MKQMVLKIISVMVTISLLGSVVYAKGEVMPLYEDIGALSYWYSSSSKIGRWSGSSTKVYTKKLNSNSSFYLSDGISHGRSQWKNALGFTVSSTTSSSSGKIKVYGGTVAQINATGKIEVKSTQNGVTSSRSQSMGKYTYQGTTKEGRQMVSAIVAIIDNSHTKAEYKKTCTHELGHALGWFGHSSKSSDIMYSKGSSVTSLTTRDKRHLAQVY